MKIDYTHITAHQSSREGARIHGLVLHTTEGHDHPSGRPPADLIELGDVFDGEEASAHLAVDEAGRFGRYVPDDAKAWAVCNYNQVTLSLEQIGFAEFDRAQWFRRHEQLHGAAEFLAYGHSHYGVPIRRGECANGAITREGVFQHSDLGIVGSGHTDCGPGYPQAYVELLARYFIAHRLHPQAPHTLRLAKDANNIRRHHGVPLIDV
jgi:N-acetylmuramoyl-L-alanine amidase-like protein